MPQPERETRHSARARSGRRQAAFGLAGATLISVAIFLILGRSEAPTPPRPAQPNPGGELAIQAEAGNGQAIRSLVGKLHPDGRPAIVGRLEPGGRLVFAHRGTGQATLDLDAPGFTHLRKTVLLSDGKRSLTLAMAPGTDLVIRVSDDRGTPLANVPVTSQAAGPEGDAPPEAFSIDATSNQTGEAVLEGVPWGRMAVSASAPGHQSVVLELETPRVEPVEVVLARTARIQGTLLTQADGSPTAGNVVVAGSGVWPPREIAVDTSGRFEIDGLPGGVYELHGAGAGTVAEPVAGLAVGPGETATTTLRLVPSVELVVRVIHEASGHPVAGASVSVGEDTLALNAATTTTDAAGEARVGGLLPRPYSVSVAAPGYVSPPSSDHVPGAQPVAVALTPATEIQGEVVDTEGRPIVGAAIDIIGDTVGGAALAMTRASLAFRQDLLAANAASPIPIARGDNLGVMAGSVPPIPLDTRRVPSATSTTSDSSGNEQRIITDSNGHFLVPGVPPGRVEVVASKDGWAFGRSAQLRISAGARTDAVRIVLLRGGQVTGRVLDDRDFPMPGVDVKLECHDDPRAHSVVTDTAGAFDLRGALGDCSVTALPPRLAPTRSQFRIGDAAVQELTLQVAGTVVRMGGSVVDSSGFPVVGAAVQVRGIDPQQPSIGAALSGVDGKVEIEGLGQPPYQIDVSHPTFAPLHLTDIRDTDGLRWVLQAGAVVRGTVSGDADRQPLVGARIELRGGPGSSHGSTRSGTLGRFEIHNITSGNYELIATHPKTLPKRHPVVVSARDVTRGEIDLGDTVVTQAGSASGTVIDRLGAPVAGARVFVGTATTTSDSQGGFVLGGLIPGPVAVEGSHAVAGSTTRPAVTKVYAGEETPGLRLRLDGRTSPTEEPNTNVDAAPPDRSPPTPPSRGTDLAFEVATGRTGVVVARVAEGSTAAQAGLRVGDTVTAIDGEPVAVASQVRSMLRGDPGTLVVIDIQRGGRPQRVKLRRERLRSP